MPVKVFESLLNASVEEVWAFHGSVEALKALTPPNQNVTIVGPETAVRNGALHQLRVVRGLLPLHWHARISEVEPPNRFVDTAERSPFRRWRHTHEFLPAPGGATLLRDTVDYELPMGPLGRLIDRLWASRDIDRLFAFRHQATQRALSANARTPD
ncbi:MAG TPA: SRPBCC family protein [Fimbriimonadaceae bacterium]|nr:SRPBCC family protein [Fimbriimonadaceae bacterium]HRJ32893.1 SRPBCC family protein [Fimbriimonadaceae bacterium]